MKKTFTLCVLCSFVIGCTGVKNDGDFGAPSDQNEIYISNDVQRIIDIDDLFDFAGFIPLETSEKSLIGEISKLIYYNEHFYILDKMRANLMVFCNEGKFIKNIGELGRGPGEFTNPVDFTINEDNGDIFILDFGARRLMVWDKEGVFVEQISLSFPALKFEILNGNYLFFTNKMVTEQTLNYEIIVTDNRGNIYSRFLKFNEENIFRLAPENVFSKNNHDISIFTCFRDTIWAYSNKTLYPRFFVNFENPIPPKYTTDPDLFNKEGVKYSFLSMNFIETKDLVFFNYIDNKQIKGVLLDKDKNERLLMKQLSNNLFKQEYFPMPAFIAEEYLVSQINNIYDWEFKFDYSEIKDNPDMTRRISEIVAKHDESSNPVLVLLKFKGIP